jgi:hypothetical protein
MAFSLYVRGRRLRRRVVNGEDKAGHVNRQPGPDCSQRDAADVLNSTARVCSQVLIESLQRSY